MPRNRGLFGQSFRRVVAQTLHCAPKQPQCVSQMLLGALKHLSSLTLLPEVDPVDELNLLIIMGKQQMLWRREQPLERRDVLVHSVRCHVVVKAQHPMLDYLKFRKIGKGVFPLYS